MNERQHVLRRTDAQWLDARQWVPDSHRKVIVLYANRLGTLTWTEARYSEGWRLLDKRHLTRRPDRIRAWMDVPWMDTRGTKDTNATPAAPVPAGAKARPEVETEAQAESRSDRTNAREETGLSPAEADFDMTREPTTEPEARG